MAYLVGAHHHERANQYLSLLQSFLEASPRAGGSGRGPDARATGVQETMAAVAQRAAHGGAGGGGSQWPQQSVQGLSEIEMSAKEGPLTRSMHRRGGSRARCKGGGAGVDGYDGPARSPRGRDFDEQS
jgi:hypothetical protein